MNWNRCSGCLPISRSTVLDQMALFIFLRQGNAEHRARRRVHCRFLQLVGVHFSQTLEAADLDLPALEDGRFQLGAVRVVAGVSGGRAGSEAIERRLGEIDVARSEEHKSELQSLMRIT